MSGSARRVAAVEATLPLLAMLVLAAAPIVTAETTTFGPADTNSNNVILLVVALGIAGILVVTRSKGLKK